MITFFVMKALAALTALLVVVAVPLWLRIINEDGLVRGVTGYTVPVRVARWLRGGAFFGPIEIASRSAR